MESGQSPISWNLHNNHPTWSTDAHKEVEWQPRRTTFLLQIATTVVRTWFAWRYCPDTHTQMWSTGKPCAYFLYPWAEFERLRQFCSVTIVALNWLAWRYLADTHSQMWSAQGNPLQISLPSTTGCAGPSRVLPLWSRGDQLKGIWRTHRCGARWNRWWKWRCPLCGYHVSMWGGWGEGGMWDCEAGIQTSQGFARY